MVIMKFAQILAHTERSISKWQLMHLNYITAKKPKRIMGQFCCFHIFSSVLLDSHSGEAEAEAQGLGPVATKAQVVCCAMGILNCAPSLSSCAQVSFWISTVSEDVPCSSMVKIRLAQLYLEPRPMVHLSGLEY